MSAWSLLPPLLWTCPRSKDVSDARRNTDDPGVFEIYRNMRSGHVIVGCSGTAHEATVSRLAAVRGIQTNDA
jgi:hypothetical protein